MAKSDRASASSHGDPKSKMRKAGRRRLATSPAPRKSAKNKAASDAVLLVEDEFNNLRAAHRAYDCVRSFLTPLHLQEFEEFHIQPTELRALMEVVNAEMLRRMQVVNEAIQSVRKALH
ncbi:hypothetical protein [Variovorax sp. GT1P44]|uniref:hypothetical protein n=1 Tax=Variovorax sp. GT1P44 TaxID=3443742 RepID=UPI003F469AAD